ncbi:MAG: DUF4364 family protein [Clostridia bacterium]
MKNLNLFDNKIIMLYILENAKSPLTIDQIAKFCVEFEDISYFDICDYITVLVKSDLVTEIIENNATMYAITESGNSTLNELLEIIPGISIFSLKKLVQKEMTNLKQEYTINTQTIPLKHDDYKVSCYIKDRNDELINISIYAGSKDQTRKIVSNWQNNAEDIYEKVLEMLTKNTDE